MKLTFMRRMFAALLAAGIAGTCAAAYPDRPVRVVVTAAAGSATDAAARLITNELAKQTGKTFVVENKGGANGAIAAQHVAASPTDGYTLLFCAASVMTINPHVLDQLNYDPFKSFQPVVNVGASPVILYAKADDKASNLREFIDRAKTESQGLLYGVSGVGSMPHLLGEMVAAASGVKLEPVPFQGGAAVLQAVLSGNVSYGIDGTSSTLPRVRSGQVKALAISTPKRHASLPEIPTIAETYPGTEAVSWFAFFSPSGTRDEVIQWLNAQVNQALAVKEVADRLEQLGIFVAGGSSQDLAASLARDHRIFGAIIKKQNIAIKK